MAGQLFTAESAWVGGFYELAMEIGPRSEKMLRSVFAALWRDPDLEAYETCLKSLGAALQGCRSYAPVL
jgi:hypothetical protein